MSAVANTVEKLLLAAPRGYCAGVDRAVQTVERTLELHGPPVYVRKEIVHNKHVVERLRERGAIFVEEQTRSARGRRHACSPPTASRPACARARGQRRPADDRRDLPARHEGPSRGRAASREDGYTIVLVGHAGHEEVEGTMGEAPERIVLVQNEHDVDELEIEDPERVAYITQTTLSVDETSSIVARLRERFPAIAGPRTDDICYATTNRQAAVKQMAGECDLMLVIGSRNSSNSVRLVEVARDCGTEAYLIDNAAEVARSGSTAGASSASPPAPARPRTSCRSSSTSSAPAACRTSRRWTWSSEDVRFMLPKPVPRGARRERRARSAEPPGATCATFRRSDPDRLRPAPRRAAPGIDVLRRPELRAALLEELAGVDRLVLLGDVLELRHGPPARGAARRPARSSKTSAARSARPRAGR